MGVFIDLLRSTTKITKVLPTRLNITKTENSTENPMYSDDNMFLTFLILLPTKNRCQQVK